VPVSQPSAASRLEDIIAGVRIENLWDAWASAEEDCDAALGAWFSAASGERARRHAAYLAALDREAHAAMVLREGLARRARR
jgi:hypothetical protein